mgnify:CR=1 FL=1
MELELIKNSILDIRGKRVILDYELAKLYEVETRALKQAVRRNIERFPADFMLTIYTSPKLSLSGDALQIELENSSELYAACECYFDLTIRAVGITDNAFKSVFSNHNKVPVEFKPYPSQFIDPNTDEKNRK